MQDVVFVGISGYIFYGHCWIKKFIELGIALFVVVDSSLPQISLTAVL